MKDQALELCAAPYADKADIAGWCRAYPYRALPSVVCVV